MKYFNEFNDNNDTRIDTYRIPIRLIDITNDREIWLMKIKVNKIQLQFERELASWLGLEWLVKIGFKFGLGHDKQGDNSWRCDLHTVWSKDFQWIAFNGMPEGKSKQVMISYVGNIEKLFNNDNGEKRR